jgi:hypothetical protein
MAIVSTLVAVLVVSKYSPMRAAIGAAASYAVTGRWDFVSVAMPVGCSFLIFQGIGYVVDTAWGRPAERNLPRFLLFMSFFPKVLMGPIERAEGLLPQIAALSASRFIYDEFRMGLLRFGWGLFKKVVIADRLALYTSEVYDEPGKYHGLVVIVATIFYAFQLLADFSGYSDMAIGCAQLFHVRLTQNFEFPYAARNIQDFWRRWHVSFSAWIATYLFTPLRMAWRGWKKAGMILSVYVTFILIGLWHGFQWTYVAMWTLHATFVCVSILTLKARESFWERHGLLERKWFRGLQMLGTFGMVTFSYVFFRAATVRDALGIYASMARWNGFEVGIHEGLEGPELTIAFAALGLWYFAEGLFHSPERLEALFRRPIPVRWATYFTLLFLVLCFGVFTKPSQFIYFRF